MTGGYTWKALDAKGGVRRGSWDLQSSADVRSRLIMEGLYPVSIRPRFSSRASWIFKDSNALWSVFIRKLSILLAAGIPLVNALETLTRVSDPSFRRVSQRLAELVGSGTDLSEAVVLVYPFPPDFSQVMIEAGERTGKLSEALTDLAEVLEKEQEFLRKLRSALAYPLFLLIAVLIVLYGLGIWVLPRYEELFANLGAELPGLSQLLFKATRLIPWFSLLGLSLGAVVFIGFKTRYKDDWRLALREKASHIPGAGGILRLRELHYFSRIMNMLLEAGLPLDDALKVALSAAKSQGMRTFAFQLLTGIEHGNRLGPILKSSSIFPLMAGEMLSMGEESGRWDEMFGYVAKSLQNEIEVRLQSTVRLVEPLMIVALAVLVGVIAAGVLLPVFDISGQIQ